jgi:hypothetical protein
MELHSFFLSKSAIQALIRDLLQCGCPETVFADVRIGVPALFDTHTVDGGLEILVGRRLLVTLVPLAALADPAEATSTILRAGRVVRDTHGLNRFRLVIVGSPGPAVRRRCDELAASLEDRVHLHLLEERDLEMACQSGQSN